jgi:hypothetical protein
VADPLAGLSADLRTVADDLNGPAMVKVIEAAGDAAVPLAEGVIRRDLGGDLRMSNWKAKFDVKTTVKNPSWLEIAPVRPGPMNVPESGRKAGRSRKGRKVSASRGLGTWTAVGVQLEKLGPVLESAIEKIMRRLG